MRNVANIVSDHMVSLDFMPILMAEVGYSEQK